MKKLFVFASVLMFLFTYISGAIAKEMKVGTLLAHTGGLGEFGPMLKDGINLAAEQMGAAGFDIELIHEDSETSAIPAVNATRKLVEVNNVVAIIGAMGSGVTQAVAESVTSPRNILLISPGASSPLLSILPADDGKDFLFRTCTSDSFQGTISGKVAASFSKTASIIYVNNAYGDGLAEYFRKSYERRGGEVLAAVPHDEEASESYTVELRKALAEKPDVLCAFSYPQHAIIYLKEAIEFFNYKNFFFCCGTKSDKILKSIGPENLEGRMGTAPGSLEGEAQVLFRNYYVQKFGKLPPLPYIANAYDASAVIGLAAYAAKLKGLALNSKNIRDNLRNVSNPPGEIIKPGEFKKAFSLLKEGKNINYEGAAGSVDFDENGDVYTPIEIWKYSNGEIVTVRMEYSPR